MGSIKLSVDREENEPKLLIIAKKDLSSRTEFGCEL